MRTDVGQEILPIAAGGGEPGAVAHRHSWVFATSFLCLTLPVGAGMAAYWAGPLAGAVAASAFVLPLLYALPRGRSLWARHGTLLLATQALLTYLPFAFFGGDWVVGFSGLLGGMLLLTVPAPGSWLLFGAALAVESVLRFAVVGHPHLTGLSETPLVLVLPVYVGMALFGLIRLASMVTELQAARTELAALTVAKERLRAAQRLRAAIGDRLDAVLTHARAALAAMPQTPAQVRARLEDAACCARQALEQVRTAVAHDRPGTAQDAGEGQHAAEPTLAPRLARLVLTLVLAALAGEFTVSAVASHASTRVVAASVAAIALLSMLQLYHAAAGRDRVRPRGWPYTLAAQLLITSLGFISVLHPAIHGLSGFVAGSALLLLPRPWGWVTFAGVQVSITVHVLWLPALGTADLVYALLVTVTTGLVVFGLSRLAVLAVELEGVRRDLARMAVVRERLRVAKDTHDLLGMGLSAIAIKSDLARRLIGRDDAAAGREIEALVRLSQQARGDVLAVASNEPNLSLHAELAAAAEVLTSAGVAAVVRTEPAVARLPEQVDAVLATLVREAVTNVLRHSRARRCEMTLGAGEGTVFLQVTNDGVAESVVDGVAGGSGDQRHRRAPAPGRDSPWQTGGRGLRNLTARVAALDGRLTAHAHGGRFELTARLPVPGPPPRQCGEATADRGPS